MQLVCRRRAAARLGTQRQTTAEQPGLAVTPCWDEKGPCAAYARVPKLSVRVMAPGLQHPIGPGPAGMQAPGTPGTHLKRAAAVAEMSQALPRAGAHALLPRRACIVSVVLLTPAEPPACQVGLKARIERGRRGIRVIWCVGDERTGVDTSTVTQLNMGETARRGHPTAPRTAAGAFAQSDLSKPQRPTVRGWGAPRVPQTGLGVGLCVPRARSGLLCAACCMPRSAACRNVRHTKGSKSHAGTRSIL